MKKIVFPGLFLIALALVVFSVTAQLGWWPVRGTSTPPQWEEKVGQSILSASFSRQAKGLTNPLRPSTEVLVAGQKIFKMNCAGCHGTPGQPSQWGTHGFTPGSHNSVINHRLCRRGKCSWRSNTGFATAGWVHGKE